MGKTLEKFLGVLVVVIIIAMVFSDLGKFLKQRLWIILIGTPVITTIVIYLLEHQGG